MKKNALFILFFIVIIVACSSKKTITTSAETTAISGDTLRIANEKLEYEVIIIDAGFNSWFVRFARPREFYQQSFLETRNRFWILEYNRRVNNLQYNRELYEMNINYESNIDYGFEVNYLLYNYLLYFQLTNKQQLGGYVARFP